MSYEIGMASVRIRSLGVAILVMTGIATWSKPEYFVDALRFGATDCSYCHTTATGGETLNERGAWLVTQKQERNADQVSVAWLTAREEVVEQEPPAPTRNAQPTNADPNLKVEIQPNGPIDYTTNFGDWPSYHGDLHGSKYAQLKQIDRDNLNQLEVAWVWESTTDTGVRSLFSRSKIPDVFKGTPIVADGRMFVRTRYSAVAAIDPATGTQLWEYDAKTQDGRRPVMFGFTTRSVAYHHHESRPRVILVTTDGWLVALDPQTGEPLEDFGDNGRVNLQVGMRRQLDRQHATWSYSPLVCNDIVVVGSQTQDELYRRGGENWNDNLPVGDVRGFDALTGEQVWVFETVPQGDDFGSDTWGNDSWKWMGNTNVWSSMSCDPKLGFVYLPVTAPSHHFYGGHRHGDNLFGTSLVALDVNTGKRQWHFQIVHHDVWDYDLPAAPVLAHIMQAGKRRDVVVQVTKTGFAFVFDRQTGEPIWPIEEREVPQSTLKGEATSPTQPFPTKPPPFEMQGLTKDDIVDFTPEIKRRALELLEDVNYGPLFTPVAEQLTVILPGIGGGANWGGASFDPISRSLFVASRRTPMFASARPVGDTGSGIGYRVDWMRYNLSIEGIPIVKPPWSSITAYDLDTGTIRFQVANGRGWKDHPMLAQLELPDLGNFEAPGLLLTPTLMFHGISSSRGDSLLVARDKETGELIWGRPVQGTFGGAHPITYRVGSTQFVAHGTGGAAQPARITAFRLAQP